MATKSDGKNVIYDDIQERVMRPKRDNFYDALISQDSISLITTTLNFMGICVGLFLVFMIVFKQQYIFSKEVLVFFYYGVFHSFVMGTAVFFGHLERKKEADEKLGYLSKNTEKDKYLIQIGTHIKEFYGDARKSSFLSNYKGPILLDAEKFKRHLAIIATVGGGKTVLMKGIAEQQLQLGGGCFIIDGKGTAEFAQEMFALACRYGRKDDFIHINFLDMDNTASINPLQNGSSSNLYEIMNSLLIGEEDQWKQKQREFMNNLLKLLVYMRDKEFVPLNFGSLSNYMDIPSLLRAAIIYRKKSKEITPIADYVKYITSCLNVNYEDFVEHDFNIIYNDGRVKSIETTLKDGNPDTFYTDILEKIKANKEQGIYDFGVSIGAWRSVITKLGSDYRNVFNTQHPTTDLWEVVQHNKMLFVTLPSMDSDQTPKELGMLLLGILKGVAQKKAKESYNPKIPFLCMFDEIGSYCVKGFGRLMSKCRALGFSIIPIFQSLSQIDEVDDGKGLETKEMLGMTGTLCIMKTTSTDVSKMINEKLGQNRFIDRSYQERRLGVEGNSHVEDSFQTQLEDKIKHHDLEKMNNGEMIVVTDGEFYKAVACAEKSLLQKGKVTTYGGNDIHTKLPITQYLNFDSFIKQAWSRRNSIFANKTFLEKYREKMKDISSEVLWYELPILSNAKSQQRQPKSNLKKGLYFTHLFEDASPFSDFVGISKEHKEKNSFKCFGALTKEQEKELNAYKEIDFDNKINKQLRELKNKSTDFGFETKYENEVA